MSEHRTSGYSSQVMDHFRYPRNVGRIEAPDGAGTAIMGTLCAFITIRVAGDRIIEAKFQSSTCVVAIAACSVVTELIQRGPLADAARLSASTVANALGGIPPERMDRCSLAVMALHNALQDQRAKADRATASGSASPSND
jgi:nitrogen fixation NifU-like protein